MKKLVLLVMLSLLLVGCMPTVATESSPSGFFLGIWHGWIAPLSLIFGFFDRSIRIYDPNNIGWWYDFGYYMAIISGFGGLQLARRKK